MGLVVAAGELPVVLLGIQEEVIVVALGTPQCRIGLLIRIFLLVLLLHVVVLVVVLGGHGQLY